MGKTNFYLYFSPRNKLKRESTCFSLLPGKITCLAELGDVFFRGNQIDNGVKSFKCALEQAKKMYPGQPLVTDILNNLGVALQRAGMLDESLRYLQEGKKNSDRHTEVGNLTSVLLNNIGTSYAKLGKSILAFQSYKDAFDSLDMTIISAKFYDELCKNMASTVIQLNPVALSKEDAIKMKSKLPSITQMFNLSKKENDEKGLKDMCSFCVNSLYQLGLSYQGHREQRVVFQCFERARETAKRFDYKCGGVVLVLLLLSMTHGEMSSLEKSRSYYEEAKAMAKSLPPEDDSILPEELGMIDLMKK